MIQYEPKTEVDQPPPDTEELIRKAQQGSLEAFTKLYEHYLPKVYNRVRFLVPEQDVEDVVQEIFIAVLKSLRSFKHASKFSTWLRTLTQRRVADYYRRQSPVEVHLDPDLGEKEGSFHGSLTGARNGATDDRMILRQAVRKLPEHYQEVLLLRFAEGLKFREIAELRGESLEATKSLFRRAIAELRNRVGEIYV